jgi:hypothetical protein
VEELEQELSQVREAVAADKKKLEDELTEERRKSQEDNTQFNTMSTGKTNYFIALSIISLYC